MKFTRARTILLKNWLLRKIPWTKYWEVIQEFVWYLNYENKVRKIIVPKWFKTDFGSIPIPMRMFFNPTKYLAYILHDFLYDIEWKIISDLSDNKQHNRLEADYILFEALEVEWMNTIWNVIIFIWVRLWWALAYDNLNK